MVNAIENMQSKIVDYCPSIKAYARVFSYTPDTEFINSFSLRKDLHYDLSKEALDFRQPVNAQNVDFPNILTNKLIAKTKELQKDFNLSSKKFL